MGIENNCRLCGRNATGAMHNIFNKYEGVQLIHLITECLPVVVYRTDPLSKEICEFCFGKIVDFHNFTKNTVKLHEDYQKFQNHPTNEAIDLYLDTVKNAIMDDFSGNITRLVKNCGTQTEFEIRSEALNATSDLLFNDKHNNSEPNSLTVLTPFKINEKSKSDKMVTLKDNDNSVKKRRRLAGPKSKTKFKYKNPSSLFQYALKQINRNLNLHESPSNESSIDNMDLQENIVSCSSNNFLTNQQIDVSLMEHNYCPSECNYKINEFALREPIICNYCMKLFDNIYDLSFHEKQHIIIDLGPRVDTKEYSVKCRLFSRYYQNYLARQNEQLADPTNTNSVVTTSKISKKPLPTVKPPVLQSHEKIITKSSVRLTAKSTEKAIVKATQKSMKANTKVSKPPPVRDVPRRTIRWTERTQNSYDMSDENSLLVPQISNSDAFFEVRNYEVYINGIMLKDMTKQERRSYYKDVIINGSKRKFCSLCRHTFKDNWAIENHYFNNICAYTCKFCGRKFKYQETLFQNHLNQHKGEPVNKIFGPTNRKYRFKKGGSRPVYVTEKVKSTKVKRVIPKKSIKKEPGLPLQERPPSLSPPPPLLPLELPLPLPSAPANHSVTLEATGSYRNEPYQAYFCRKCFKVFFNVDEYNVHVRVCTGQNSSSNTSEVSKRPIRRCVRDISSLNENNEEEDDDDDYQDKKPVAKKCKIQGDLKTGYECGICCSAFPSVQARNSHMRIHKGITRPSSKKAIVKTPNVIKVENTDAAPSDIRLANLNPAVARLVQNNPHLTIRSYSKAQLEKSRQPKSLPPATVAPINKVQSTYQYDSAAPEHNIKRVYKCADCEERFENKSILYYHKMNSCIVKRHYECAFCKKKFGSYDHYNTHVFYVHPE